MLCAQSGNFSFINSLCLPTSMPSTSQVDTVKQEVDIQSKEEKNLDKVRYFVKFLKLYSLVRRLTAEI